MKAIHILIISLFTIAINAQTFGKHKHTKPNINNTSFERKYRTTPNPKDYLGSENWQKRCAY